MNNVKAVEESIGKEDMKSKKLVEMFVQTICVILSDASDKSKDNTNKQ